MKNEEILIDEYGLARDNATFMAFKDGKKVRYKRSEEQQFVYFKDNCVYDEKGQKQNSVFYFFDWIYRYPEDWEIIDNNFIWALKQMKKGKRVTTKEIHERNNMFFICVNERQEIWVNDLIYKININLMLRNDWILFDDEK
jgi:hypothetical protein